MRFKVLLKVDMEGREEGDVAATCAEIEGSLRIMIDTIMAEEFPAFKYTLLTSVY